MQLCPGLINRSPPSDLGPLAFTKGNYISCELLWSCERKLSDIRIEIKDSSEFALGRDVCVFVWARERSAR